MVKPPVLHVAVFEVDTNVDADEAISRVHGAGYMGITMVDKRERTVQRLQARSLHNAAPLPCGVATERGTVVQAGHASGLQDVSQKESDGVSRRHRPDDVAVYVHQVRSDIKPDIAPRGLVRMVARDVDGVVWVQREVIGRVHGRLAGCGGAAVAQDLLLFHCGDYKQLTGTRDKKFLRNHVPAPDVIVVPELAEVWDHHTTAGVRPAQRTVCARKARTIGKRGVVTIVGHRGQPASTATADSGWVTSSMCVPQRQNARGDFHLAKHILSTQRRLCVHV